MGDSSMDDTHRALATVLNHETSQEVERLEEEVRRLKAALDFVGNEAGKMATFYDFLLWAERHGGSLDDIARCVPDHVANLKDKCGENAMSRIEHILESVSQWDCGFHWGLMASSRLFGELAGITHDKVVRIEHYDDDDFEDSDEEEPPQRLFVKTAESQCAEALSNSLDLDI